MLKQRILACLLTLSAIAATSATISQTAPDYAAIIAAPDRSDADHKLDTNRVPVQWLAFIGAKPGMKILDIISVQQRVHCEPCGCGRGWPDGY